MKHWRLGGAPTIPSVKCVTSACVAIDKIYGNSNLVVLLCFIHLPQLKQKNEQKADNKIVTKQYATMY